MAQFEKDFRRLCRQIDSLSDGQARASLDNIFDRSTTSLSRASISSDSSSSSDSEELTSSLAFHIEITPRDGPYAHGSYVFRIETSPESDYPDCQPIVSCLTPIYHPNIDTTYRNRHNNICVSTLNDWDGGVNSKLEDLLQGLMFLFHSPNVDDPLTSNVSTDEEEFLKNVRIAIEGGSIEDFDENDIFEMNYGYKRYLIEQEKQQLEEEEKQQIEEEEEKQQIEEGEKIDDHLISILTRETNFREIFTADTLEFLMNNTSASSLTHSTRHNKETSTNS